MTSFHVESFACSFIEPSVNATSGSAKEIIGCSLIGNPLHRYSSKVRPESELLFNSKERRNTIGDILLEISVIVILFIKR